MGHRRRYATSATELDRIRRPGSRPSHPKQFRHTNDGVARTAIERASGSRVRSNRICIQLGCAPQLANGDRFASVSSEIRSVSHLPHPEATEPQRIDWPYASTVAIFHLVALLAFVPWFFRWAGVLLCAVSGFLLGFLGINTCFHRLLTHRSFECPKIALAFLHIPCLMLIRLVRGLDIAGTGLVALALAVVPVALLTTKRPVVVETAMLILIGQAIRRALGAAHEASAASEVSAAELKSIISTRDRELLITTGRADETRALLERFEAEMAKSIGALHSAATALLGSAGHLGTSAAEASA